METESIPTYQSTYFLAKVIHDTFRKYSFCGASEFKGDELEFFMIIDLDMEPWSFMDYLSKNFDQKIEDENFINSLDEDKEVIELTINDFDKECVDFENFGNFLDKYFENGVTKFIVQNIVPQRDSNSVLDGK